MTEEVTALDVAKEWAALAGKAIFYLTIFTAGIGGFILVSLWFTTGIHEALRIWK